MYPPIRLSMCDASQEYIKEISLYHTGITELWFILEDYMPDTLYISVHGKITHVLSWQLCLGDFLRYSIVVMFDQLVLALYIANHFILDHCNYPIPDPWKDLVIPDYYGQSQYPPPEP